MTIDTTIGTSFDAGTTFDAPAEAHLTAPIKPQVKAPTHRLRPVPHARPDLARERHPVRRSDLPADPGAADAAQLSRVVVLLLKGVVYRENDELLWRELLRRRAAVADYLAVMGMTVAVDEAEGFAYCRSLPGDEPERPRLIPRRQMSFHLSLLLALLRKQLAELDACGRPTRLFLTRDEIADTLVRFLPTGTTQARLLSQVDATIARARDLGFVREVLGTDSTFEVQRVLKAFVDAQWLAEFDARLAGYAAQLNPAPAH